MPDSECQSQNPAQHLNIQTPVQSFAQEFTPEQPLQRPTEPPHAPGRPPRGFTRGENGLGLDDPDVDVSPCLEELRANVMLQSVNVFGNSKAHIVSVERSFNLFPPGSDHVFTVRVAT